MTRAQKEEKIAQMTEKLAKSQGVILVNFHGLKVKEIQDFKKKLKEKGIEFQIIKNTLLKIALGKNNLTISPSILDQPLAVVWGNDDEIEAAKEAVEFGKAAGKLKILGGIINQAFTDVEIIKKLAALPSREKLYFRLVGTLNASAYGLVNVLQGNLRALVYILRQYQEKKV